MSKFDNAYYFLLSESNKLTRTTEITDNQEAIFLFTYVYNLCGKHVNKK